MEGIEAQNRLRLSITSFGRFYFLLLHFISTLLYMSNNVVTQLGFVFDGLQYTRDIKDLKLLLIEDDHYLMPDAIHMIRQLSKK